jgi:tetratricopeptide (TPR) repeat protein
VTRLIALAFAAIVFFAPGAGAQDVPPVVAEIQAALERGDLPSARRVVEAALAGAPTSPALHNFAGVVAAQQGAALEAEGHFKEAIRLAPRSVPPRENLARLYQERAAADPAARGTALDAYAALLALDPGHEGAIFQSAVLRAWGGEFQQARALVARLPADLRARPPVLALLVPIRAGLGDAAGADAALASLAAHKELTEADAVAVVPALERVKDDEATLGRVLAVLDRRGLVTPDILRRLGVIQLRHGQAAEAREVLERAARGGGASVPVLIDLARAAGLTGDHQGALGYLAHARSLEPDNAIVHFLFGVVCVQANLGREAHESLEKAVTLAPDNPDINYAMGAVAMTRRDPSESLPYLEKYVRARPDDPRGRFVLGAARVLSQQYDEARADLELAVKSPVTALGAHYYLGRLARQLNDLPTAEREIQAALALAPTYADAWAELGLVQIRQGNTAAAEASIGKALAIEPEHYAATLNLATLYGRTKDPRRADTEARLKQLQEKREQRAQEFLRLVEVVPPSR